MTEPHNSAKRGEQTGNKIAFAEIALVIILGSTATAPKAAIRSFASMCCMSALSWPSAHIDDALNELLRQYLSKCTYLSIYSQDALDAIARSPNSTKMALRSLDK